MWAFCGPPKGIVLGNTGIYFLFCGAGHNCPPLHTSLCSVRPPKAPCRKDRGTVLCYLLGSVLKEPHCSLQSWSIVRGHLVSAELFSHLTGLTHRWCSLVVTGWGQIWLWSGLALPLHSIFWSGLCWRSTVNTEEKQWSSYSEMGSNAVEIICSRD